jgi:hypothetical protein
MLAVLRKGCLFDIINKGNLQELLENLLSTPEQQENFSNFLKVQFNTSIIQVLQIGHKKEYQKIKSKMKEIFEFCMKSDKYEPFIESFLHKDILKAGAKSIKDFRAEKTKKITDYFQYEEKAISGLNPYLLRFFTSHAIKNGYHEFLGVKNCLPSLFNLHLCMVMYFQDHKSLVVKLLKSALKIIAYLK